MELKNIFVRWSYQYIYFGMKSTTYCVHIFINNVHMKNHIVKDASKDNKEIYTSVLQKFALLILLDFVELS